MTVAVRHLVSGLPTAAGVVIVIGTFLILLLVLVGGGIWGFRIVDGEGRGGGGSKRPPSSEPPPPDGGHELPADFEAWEAELQAAGDEAPAGDREASGTIGHW
jgi:hypothetical protein